MRLFEMRKRMDLSKRFVVEIIDVT